MLSIVFVPALAAIGHLASATPAPRVSVLPAPSALGLFEDPVIPEEPEWTGSIAAGGTYTTGNSDSRSGNVTADAELRRKKDRFTLGFLWLYAEDKNASLTNDWVLTDRRTSGRAKYDYFLTEKTYVLAQTSAEADHQAQLDLRTSLGVGAGRQFKENEKVAFSGELGISYVTEDYDVTDDEYIAARAAYTGRWNMNKMFALNQIGEIVPSLEDADDVYAKLDTRLACTFTASFVGQIQWILDYDNTPAPGAERVDNRFLLAIGWKF